jgi:hypothetical protein
MGVCGWVHGRFTPHRAGFAWNRLALLIILGRVMQSCLDASSWSALLMISLMSDWKQVAVEALG